MYEIDKPKVLRMKQLPDVLGVSKSAIYTWIREDKFPKPIKLNGVSAWDTNDIDNWIAEKKEQTV
jgi:prophage regulatory protein